MPKDRIKLGMSRENLDCILLLIQEITIKTLKKKKRISFADKSDQEKQYVNTLTISLVDHIFTVMSLIIQTGNE